MFRNKMSNTFLTNLMARPRDVNNDLGDFMICTTCTCCSRHQTNRPMRMLNNNIDYPWKGGNGYERKQDCDCTCRITTRLLTYHYSNYLQTWNCRICSDNSFEYGTRT